MRNSLKAWVAVAAVGMVAGGCNCDNNKPAIQCDSIQVKIDSPTTEQMFSDPVINVSAEILDEKGNAFDDIASATVCAKADSATSDCTGVPATVETNKVSLSGVTLQAGGSTVFVTIVRKSDPTCLRKASVHVTYTGNTNDGGTPSVTCTGFPQDNSPMDGVVNSLELPAGSQLKVDVTSSNLSGGTIEVLDVDNANASVASGTSPEILLAASASDALAGVKHFAVQGTASDGTKTAVADCPAISFDRTPPTCGVSAPTKSVLGLGDDSDSNTAGFQVSVSGITNNKATDIELNLTGTLNDGGAYAQTTGFQAVSAGGLASSFTVDAAGTTDYSVSVVAKDSAGNLCQASQAFTADFDAPLITILSPDAGDVFNTFDVPVVAFVQDRLSDGGVGPAQGQITFFAKQGGSTNQTGAITLDGGYGSGLLNSFGGANSLTAVATDLASNGADAGPVAYTVETDGATGCSIAITQPTNGQLITASYLVGGNYTVVANSNCPGQTASLTVNGSVVATGTTMSNGSVSFTFMPTDGTNQVWAVAVDGSTASVTVTVATTNPSISQPGNPSTLNVARDLNAGTAGVQTTLSFTSPGAVAVCVDVNLTGSLGACPGGTTGWFVLQSNVTSPQTAFTFPDGLAPTYAYNLKVVYGTGSGALESPPVALVVDSVRPLVSNYKLVGDLNSDNMLNLVELNGQTPKLTFDVTGDGLATIGTRITVQNTAGSTVYNKNTGNSWTSSNVVVPLDQNIATEGTYTWNIVVTDEAGNSNLPLPVLAGWRIDGVAPDCSIAQPVNNGVLHLTDDADPVANGWQLRARVSTSADVTSVPVTLSGSQSGTQTATAGGGFAQTDFTLSSATGGTYGVSAVCTDLAGNPTTAAPVTNVLVDLVPPTCTITLPTPGSTSGSFANTTTVVSDAIGQTVTVSSQIGAGLPAQVGTLVVQSNGTATGTLNYPNGAQTVTAQVQDPAGNVTTCAGVMFTVNAVGCDIAFAQPLVNGTTGIAYLNQTVNSVIGHTASCGAGKTVSLYNVVSGTPTMLSSGVTDSSGNVTLSHGLSDGTGYTLRLVIDNGAGVLTSVDLAPVTIDTVLPTVGSAVPANATQLYFVASADNYNVLQGTAGYYADLSAGAPADVHVGVTNINGANGGQVQVLYGPSAGSLVQIGQQDVTSDTGFNASIAVTLANNTTGAFEIRVLDQAGNVVKPTSSPAAVDVIPPAAPTVTPTLSNARTAIVNLSWGPVYDDGSTSTSGPVAAYDLRWSTTSVTGNNNLASATDYFDSTKADKEMDIAWSASTISHDLNVPPMNGYYIVVRAKDEVGNYSSYTAPTVFNNPGTQDILSNPTGTTNQGFGRVLAANGSVNGDSLDDLLVGVNGSRSVYVYFGASGFGSQTGCPAGACQTISLPVALSGDNFGTDVAVGDVGDTLASDILVGSSTFNSAQGRAFLFFGGANPVDTTTFIQFRGSTTLTQFGRPVQIIPSIDSDAIGEIVISAPGENSGRGRIYIFKGRTKANWEALETGVDGVTGEVFVPVSAADWIIDGPLPVDVTSFAGNSFGGVKAGFTVLGDITGDGKADFVIPCSKDNLNRSYLWSGSAVAASSASTPLTTGDGATADQSMERLVNSNFGPGTSTSGFGAAAKGNVDVLNGTGLDLVIGHPLVSSLFIYADGSSSGFPTTPAWTITGSNFFGVTVTAGDYTNDGKVDILTAEGGTTTSIWLLTSHGGTFDKTAGSGFWMSKLTGNSLGGSVVTGDFDGNGKVDFAAGDNLNAPGKVTVWHP